MSEQRRSTARLAAHWRARLLPAGLLAALSLSLELCLYLVAVIGGMATPHMAVALPLYARQTGQPCATCHTAFLELTPFGRRFKLGGYTLGGGNWNGPPFAVMLQPTFTNTQGAQPGGAAPGFGVNNNFVMQQISQQRMGLAHTSFNALTGYIDAERQGVDEGAHDLVSTFTTLHPPKQNSAKDDLFTSGELGQHPCPGQVA